MEDRSRRNAGLKSTGLAVIETLGQVPILTMIALGANKAIRPAKLHRMTGTGFVIGKIALKPNQTSLLVSLAHIS
jgi:hypothetical protein